MLYSGNIWFAFAASSLRYLFFAGIAYLFFYVWKKKAMFRYKIQKQFPGAKAVTTEIKYSLLTAQIFAVVIYLFVFGPVSAYTQIYTDIHARSLWYFFFSIVVIIFLHDTYFYWTHRLMHWKKIFPYVHHIHHRSHNPTPWAAFSFHPLEALIEIGIIPLVVLIIPVHPFALAVFGLYMIVLNVIGHLGYEIFPVQFIRHPFFKWMNTSTHHNMHHHFSKCNYGLYFNLWDRLLNTNHSKYEEEFTRVVKKAKDEKNVTATDSHSFSI